MIREWYIGFHGDYPGRSYRWYDVFTCKDFRHVLVMGYDLEAEAWVVFDPSSKRYALEVYPKDAEMVANIMQWVPRWLVLPEKEKEIRTFGLTWCVKAVCRVIGFRSCALRPKGLYHDLVRHGAREISIQGKTCGN